MLDLSFTDDVLRACLADRLDPLATLMEKELSDSGFEIEALEADWRKYVVTIKGAEYIFDLPYVVTDMLVIAAHDTGQTIKPFNVSLINRGDSGGAPIKRQ